MPMFCMKKIASVVGHSESVPHPDTKELGVVDPTAFKYGDVVITAATTCFQLKHIKPKKFHVSPPKVCNSNSSVTKAPNVPKAFKLT